MHDEPTVTVRIELFDDEPETAEETRRDCAADGARRRRADGRA